VVILQLVVVLVVRLKNLCQRTNFFNFKINQDLLISFKVHPVVLYYKTAFLRFYQFFAWIFSIFLFLLVFDSSIIIFFQIPCW
jgi:hypothetical protein